MLSTLLLFTILVAAGQSSEPKYKDFFKKCYILQHPGIKNCCEFPRGGPSSATTHDIDLDMKECYSMPMEAFSCERDKCITNKMGLTSSDGKIDKDKMMNLLEKEIGGAPSILEALKENCVEGDLSAYGPDNCLFQQLSNCVDIQVLGSCPKWSSKTHCSGMKEAAAECYKDMYQ